MLRLIMTRYFPMIGPSGLAV